LLNNNVDENIVGDYSFALQKFSIKLYFQLHTACGKFCILPHQISHVWAKWNIIFILHKRVVIFSRNNWNNLWALIKKKPKRTDALWSPRSHGNVRDTMVSCTWKFFSRKKEKKSSQCQWVWIVRKEKIETIVWIFCLHFSFCLFNRLIVF
jgi:hypothetical protein